MNNQDEAMKFIDKLFEKYGKGGYIFRGTTICCSEQEGYDRIRDGINSTLYRSYTGENKEESGLSDKEWEKIKKIFSENKKLFLVIMEKAISENALKISQNSKGRHEILTDLQHFGYKTNMIDFSRSLRIALFFACQEKFEEDGELIILHTKNFSLEKEEIKIIDAANTAVSHRRANFQESVFVHSANGYINPDLCEIKVIAKEHKAPILEYLQKKEGIDFNTVYGKPRSSAKDQESNERASHYFHMGLFYLKKHQYEKAIFYYGECIDEDSSEPTAHYSRGAAYYNWGSACQWREKYQLAVDNFSAAILRNRKYARAYFARGVTYAKLEDFDSAIPDLKEATKLFPDYTVACAEAYYELGHAKIQNGDEKGGQADIAKSEEMGFSPHG